MKKYSTLSLLLAAALLPASCERPSDLSVSGNGLARAIIKVDGSCSPGTRATGVTAAEEDNIKNLQILVFDENGVLEDYVDAGASSTGEILAREGRKTIVAAVNSPALDDVRSKSGLMARTTLLSDNSLGSMVMTGEVEAVLQNGGRITIPVSRIISKVVIRKITSAFSSTSLASTEFKIKSIYLINVAGDNRLSGTSLPSMWYNKLSDGRNDVSCASFPLLSDPVNSVIAFGGSYTKEHSFFCYPNLVSEESFDSTWSPRHTMLVVDALLGGAQTYYPVELPAIGRNKCIIIDELVITRKGSDYPYIPVTTGTCNVSVEVVPWDVILQYTETI